MNHHRVRRAPRERCEGGLGGVDSPALEHIGKQQGFSAAKEGSELVGGGVASGRGLRGGESGRGG